MFVVVVKGGGRVYALLLCKRGICLWGSCDVSV